MLTTTEFWTVISAMSGMILGFFSWALWVARKLSEHGTRICQLEKDKEKDDLKNLQERNLLSEEFTAGQTRIYDKLDKIIEIMNHMKVNCGRHDERLKKLEGVK